MAEILDTAGSLDPSQTVSLKWCSKCRETKPLGEFYRQAASRDGRQHYCKPCGNKATRPGKRKYNNRIRAFRPWQEMLASIGAP